MNAEMLARLLPGGVSSVPHSVVYVDNLATGNNDGSSWANAYTDLQTAVDNSNGADIWVKGNGTANPYGTLILTAANRSYLYGGFAGTESALSERISGYETVIYGTSTETGVFIDGINCTNSSGNELIDRFTIIVEADYARGIYGVRGTISNCKIKVSGGMYAYGIYTTYVKMFNSLLIAYASSDGTSSGSSYSPAVARGAYANGLFVNCTFIGIVSESTSVATAQGFSYYSGNNGWKIYNCAAKHYNGSYNEKDWNLGTATGVPASSYAFDYNIWPERITEPTADYWGEHNIINAEALFVNGGSVDGDYSLQSSSPCIDAGYNAQIAAYELDLSFNSRISNSTVDIGCYEYQA